MAAIAEVEKFSEWLNESEVGLNLWPEVTYRRGATIPAAQIHAA